MSTADVVYCIEDVKKIPTKQDYSSEFEWRDCENDYCCLGNSDKELFKTIKNDYEDLYNIIIKEYKDAETEQSIEEWFEETIEDEDSLSDFKHNAIERIYYLEERFIVYDAPHSFFEKDVKEHLKLNNYHYFDKAVTYGVCNWRSPMMNKLRNILKHDLKLDDNAI